MAIYDKASLVLIPSGTKTSKVYSQKPTNGDGDFTFSRSTAATRVNASGNIEKETQNLLLQSNTFNTTWAAILGASVTSGQSGYDGSNDAWTFTKASGQSSRIYQNITLSSTLHTTSIYAKAGTLQYLSILEFSGPVVYFDLTNGTIGTISGNPIDVKIEAVGATGWYRCSITDDNPITQLRIYASDTDGSINGAGTIFIQDAQLEQGLVARDYIETTTTAIYGGITDNVPRLDYTDSSCPALLLEPLSTNLITQSEYYGGSSWIKTGATSVSSTFISSPEGILNASSVSGLTGSGTNDLIHSIGVNPASKTYTASIYLKGSGTIRLQLSNNIDNSGSKMVTLSNDWQRHAITHTFNATSASLALAIDDNGGATATEYDIWGVQMEEGSYATSYIPTYGSAVTRNVDTNYIQNTFSGLSGANSLTIFFEVDVEDVISLGQRYSLLTDLTGSQNWIFLSYESSGSVRGYIRENSSVSWDYQWSSGFPTSGTIKAALVIPADGNAKLYGNGLLRVENSGAVLTAAYDTIAFGGTSGAAGNKQRLKQFMIFPTALTDQEAIDLTTI